jgi:hypothetical protein
MEETGVVENPNWATRLLPDFEPGPGQAALYDLNPWLKMDCRVASTKR